MKNLNELKKMLEGFENGSRFYWVQVLEKRGDISKSEAGKLCIELGILA